MIYAGALIYRFIGLCPLDITELTKIYCVLWLLMHNKLVYFIKWLEAQTFFQPDHCNILLRRWPTISVIIRCQWFNHMTRQVLQEGIKTVWVDHWWYLATHTQAKMANTPHSNVHGAYMGPTWGRQDPGGPHVGPMNIVIGDYIAKDQNKGSKTVCFILYIISRDMHSYWQWQTLYCLWY